MGQMNDSPDDQLLLQIQGAIAEYERAKLLERCRRGRLHRARRGQLAPPNTPYGYSYAARKYGGDGVPDQRMYTPKTRMMSIVRRRQPSEPDR